MVLSVRSPSSSCEAMMQEIAESSVESILTGMDTPEYHSYHVQPDTPMVYGMSPTPATCTTPCDYVASEWLCSAPTVSSSYGGVHGSSSWSKSFCDTTTDVSGGQFRGLNRQMSTSGYSSGISCEEDNNSFGSLYGARNNMNRSDSGYSTATTANSTPPPMGITTVMLRNIPNKYTRSGLLGALVDKGFDPTIECNNLYLPMDASSGCNLGYAFLNFTSHEKALDFMHQFDGVRLPSAGSRKVCTVVWANKQGLFQHSNPPIVDGGDSPDQSRSGHPSPVNCSIRGNDGLLPTNVPDMHQVPLCGAGSHPSQPTCKIFVGGLPSNTTDNDLIDYFEKFGPIKEASIVANRQTGLSRGFGFCEFFTCDSVDRVQMAQSRKPHSINCRVVSVRPYNFNQLLMSNGGHHTPSFNSFNDEEDQAQQMRFTFFMGQGGIHPYPNENQITSTDSFSSY